MDDFTVDTLRALILKAVDECIDTEVLDLIYKLLCFL